MIIRSIPELDTGHWISTDLEEKTGIYGIGNNWAESKEDFLNKLRATGNDEKITGHIAGDWSQFLKALEEEKKKLEEIPIVKQNGYYAYTLPFKGRIPNTIIVGDGG